MPARSAGCYQCRKRKIACDLTRPGCHRCKTHGVPCPGYREPAPGQIAFADETGEVVRRVQMGKKGGRGSLVKIEFFDDGAATRTKALAPAVPAVPAVENDLFDVSQPSNAFLRQALDFMSSPYGQSNGGQLSLNSLSSSSTPFSMLTAPSTPKNDQEYGQIRRQTSMDIAKAMAFYAVPQYMPSAAAEKAMIYNAFVETYMPKYRPERDSHFAFLEHLITCPNLRPEVNQALDALCLVQVGSIYHNQTLLKQSVRMYAKALTGLVRTLGGTDAASFITDDYVLATVTLLASCEFFDEISQMGNGWSKHIQGSQQLLKARGPKSIKSKMSLMMYSNMRHGTLAHGLLTRKGTFLGRPEWRILSWCPELKDATTGFYEFSLQVPDLLEKWDLYANSGAKSVGALDAFLDEAKRIEDGLSIWYKDFPSQAKTPGTPLYTLTDVEHFSIFASLVSNRAIDQGFIFSSFMVAYMMSSYWYVMHYLRTTVKSIQHARYQADPTWYPAVDEGVVEDELLGYVMNMMRCFPFFCEPTSSSTGQIGMFLPLYTAAFYCLEHGHWALLKWLGEVRDNVFTRGMRPPAVIESHPAGTAQVHVGKWAEPFKKAAAGTTSGLPEYTPHAGVSEPANDQEVVGIPDPAWTDDCVGVLHEAQLT